MQFAKLVDFLNFNRICYLEVAVWILEDIKLICEQFVSISFVYVPLRCNRAALALASSTNERLEVCPSFLFLIVQCDIE